MTSLMLSLPEPSQTTIWFFPSAAWKGVLAQPVTLDNSQQLPDSFVNTHTWCLYEPISTLHTQSNFNLSLSLSNMEGTSLSF